MDTELPHESIQKIIDAYKSYMEEHKPIEYILEHVEFFGVKFYVNQATLIPRPETEYMITAVSEYIRMQGDQWANNLLMDIGTWCWVLGISVLLQNPGVFSEAILTDHYADALDVAKKNYKNLIKKDDVKITFLHSDLLNFLFDGTYDLPQGNAILVANLPYIPDKVFDENVSDNVKNREPRPAFVWGEDGLDYYKKMFDQILMLTEGYKLHADGFVMFLEMMTRQVDILRKLYGAQFIFEEVKTFHFNIRIIKATIR